MNLSGDSGDAWISAAVVNSSGASRGAVALQRGTRKTFKCTGTKGYEYGLQLTKTYNTGGGQVVISGSWSPDTK